MKTYDIWRATPEPYSYDLAAVERVATANAPAARERWHAVARGHVGFVTFPEFLARAEACFDQAAERAAAEMADVGPGATAWVVHMAERRGGWLKSPGWLAPRMMRALEARGVAARALWVDHDRRSVGGPSFAVRAGGPVGQDDVVVIADDASYTGAFIGSALVWLLRTVDPRRVVAAVVFVSHQNEDWSLFEKLGADATLSNAPGVLRRIAPVLVCGARMPRETVFQHNAIYSCVQVLQPPLWGDDDTNAEETERTDEGRPAIP